MQRQLRNYFEFFILECQGMTQFSSSSRPCLLSLFLFIFCLVADAFSSATVEIKSWRLYWIFHLIYSALSFFFFSLFENVEIVWIMQLFSLFAYDYFWFTYLLNIFMCQVSVLLDSFFPKWHRATETVMIVSNWIFCSAWSIYLFLLFEKMLK